MTIGIIGFGIMGSAIARALAGANGHTVIAWDTDSGRLNSVESSHCKRAQTLLWLFQKADWIIIAVKPQQAGELFANLQSFVDSRHLFISIIAGVSMSRLQKELGTSRVVRAMPNTPLQVSQGMTVWVAGGSVSSEERNAVKDILQLFGKEIELEDEGLIDAATAISGSGPAYVFLLAQALEESARALGFTREQARELAQQTLVGSSALYANGDTAPEELRQRVTSPEGTTQAAMDVIGPGQFVERWKRATRAAYERAKELAEK